MNSWTIEDHRCGVQRQRRSLVRQFQTFHGQPFPNSNWRGFVLQLTGGNNRLLSMTKLTFQSHIFPSDSCLCTASARSITTPLKWTTKFECRRRAMSTSATATWAVGARSSTKPAARLRLKIRYGNFKHLNLMIIELNWFIRTLALQLWPPITRWLRIEDMPSSPPSNPAESSSWIRSVRRIPPSSARPSKSSKL